MKKFERGQKVKLLKPLTLDGRMVLGAGTICTVMAQQDNRVALIELNMDLRASGELLAVHGDLLEQTGETSNVIYIDFKAKQRVA